MNIAYFQKNLLFAMSRAARLLCVPVAVLLVPFVLFVQAASNSLAYLIQGIKNGDNMEQYLWAADY